jgi:serine/threonine-protein kinase
MGKEATEASDVYGLGLLLFYFIAGKAPFRGSNAIQTSAKHLTETVPSPSEINPHVIVPPLIERVMRKCLEKNPADRFPSMKQLAAALE